MDEKKYSREEIFAMLQDPQKFQEFLQSQQPVTRAEAELQRPQNTFGTNYDRYLASGSVLQQENMTCMREDGSLYHKPNPFVVAEAPKITRDEYELLEFCHNTDMIPFLAEEFRRNPINRQDAQKSFENMARNACSAYIQRYNPNLPYEQNVQKAFDPNDFRNEDW